MKLLTSNGERVEIRDIGEPIYEMIAHKGSMLGCHGKHIVSDDFARDFINNNKKFATCKNLKGK